MSTPSSSRVLNAMGALMVAAGFVAVLGIVLGLWGSGIVLTQNVSGGATSASMAVLFALIIGLLGATACVLFALAYLIIPLLRRELVRVGIGSHYNIIASVVVSVALSTAFVGAVGIVGLVLGRTGVLFGYGDGLSLPQVSSWGILVSSVALGVAFFGVLYFRLVRTGVFSWAELGFRSVSWRKEALVGVGTGAGLLALSVGVGSLLSALGVPEAQGSMFDGIRSASWYEFGIVLVGVSVVAPLCEETFFRGFVFGTYSMSKGRWAAYLLSAIVFSALHFDLAGGFVLFLMGLVLALVYSRSSGLVAPMVAHGVNNAVAIGWLYLVH